MQQNDLSYPPAAGRATQSGFSPQAKDPDSMNAFMQALGRYLATQQQPQQGAQSPQDEFWSGYDPTRGVAPALGKTPAWTTPGPDQPPQYQPMPHLGEPLPNQDDGSSSKYGSLYSLDDDEKSAK